jgi:HTH-type transcriptional regulator/antitoxin HigA
MGSGLGLHPDWVSAPGETMRDILEVRGMSISAFGAELGEPADQVSALLDGRMPITLSIARRLAAVLGSSVEFWMCREAEYREDSLRVFASYAVWLDELPVGDMIKFNWIPAMQTPVELVDASLRFFGVSSPKDWEKSWSSGANAVAFRTSAAHLSTRGAVAAWLRRAELEANGIDCGKWNPEGFRQALTAIRSLTRRKTPARFIDDLRRICAAKGVAVVVLQAPKGCRASGATTFIDKTKALLVLSQRYVTDDHFWFSFFHEAAHLLLHVHDGALLEFPDDVDSPLEAEANDFAADVLIPPEYRETLSHLKVDARAVIRFAIHLGIAPGIVVGQLQHSGRLTYSQLRRLRRPLDWTST